MGFLDSILGHKEQQLPELDSQSLAARRLERQRAHADAFAGKVKDRLEFVPADAATYVFIGKPPGTFGIAWLENGEEHNLKTLLQKRGLAGQAATPITEALRSAYEMHQNEPRYQTRLGGKTVTVTPSDGLASQIGRILDNVS